MHLQFFEGWGGFTVHSVQCNMHVSMGSEGTLFTSGGEFILSSSLKEKRRLTQEQYEKEYQEVSQAH